MIEPKFLARRGTPLALLDDIDSGQQMKINVKRKIKYKGQEYSSVEELPPEVRAAYEKAMATSGASVSTKIVFNGQEYASLDQMPAAERQLYEDALKLTHDTEAIAIAPARKAGTAALLTNRQRQLVLLFAVLVVIAVIIFLLKR
jgi:2-phospho-L-lactate guanylyltransferase (CobY/MobA/RfbA family)